MWHLHVYSAKSSKLSKYKRPRDQWKEIIIYRFLKVVVHPFYKAIERIVILVLLLAVATHAFIVIKRSFGKIQTLRCVPIAEVFNYLRILDGAGT